MAPRRRCHSSRGGGGGSCCSSSCCSSCFHQLLLLLLLLLVVVVVRACATYSHALLLHPHHRILQASGALASVIGNPFDISMVRMQADSLRPAAERRGYKHVFDALARISREEGVRNLWRGFEPTVFRAIAMNVGMMATYDIVKESVVKFNGDNFTSSLASSAGAALACVCTSLPFDLIKTRLQNMKPDAAGAFPYRGVLDCAGKIATLEGPLAFWTGFGAYYGRTAPHAMIILLSMEQINKLYAATFIAQ